MNSRSRMNCRTKYRHLSHGRRMTTPDKREAVLSRMGFASYQDYLKSPLWKKIKADQLTRCGTCEICEATAKVVHHIRYTKEILNGTNALPLVSLCNGCHYKIEFKEDGEKRTYEAAAAKTKQRLVKVDRWQFHVRTRPQ